jgi:hypothetical protein
MKHKIDLESWRTVPLPRSDEEEELDRVLREKLAAATQPPAPADPSKRPS